MFKIENLDDVWKVVSPTKDGLIRLKPVSYTHLTLPTN